ncbi:MAG: cell division ATP-binding protein FtsE [Candidatus Taylorbacteria bacterium RIFCSPLOWO2_12_FULL_48_11]|uniref:Cell division ATP-binding protein FtsE n=1 Tax=Candidatus Taylorbacteria bacterium RIFCSPLOWO2_01_FULL_48_100 TaxID=1802322 RepID=A0A1G2NHF6_9BACT|nr:MAG: cell division ATP-binding protein FtsE [Candidatus Taylorbacteria bacterium RIFCSPHIGHO2_01_FULL_48_38]OHA34831.1 MAG: cell division ATP-binding protein FtsE [Candidatus Taylorbacteria bacterium RIFCSPLOWO2_01_FULL_48_100]OHA40257.1 MAG: cell division ATP-binding protein FtsE [Candidatus Taylorbacteria bacterium RIFCSPLOWO2_02_FULL_48_16]OHA45409.1 MAG: cell division ATP-binding protein FtsE [Candidatus Taylorbacteria bacterium RIFCSPLOWO2_12_FULL_48_11]
MLHFDKVYKKYNGCMALDGISFRVSPREFVSVVGHSGAGKTTLLKMLLAEERPTDGSVFFEQTDIYNLPSREMNALRRRIGVVFQDYRLLQNRTAYENIAFAMEASGKSDDEIAADVPHALELVDLGEKMWNFPHELSGGEKQRVAIARAIVNQPDVLIADEPTGNLDPMNTYDIVQILKRINDLGTTVMLTTHNKGVIDSLGRRVITMEHGKIVRDDPEGRYVL